MKLLFFGADGHWRRLTMSDLDLPQSLLYSDTYGSGLLSADGRQWIGNSSEGLILLNLRTGRWHLQPIAGAAPGSAEWIPGRDAVIAVRGSRGVEVNFHGGGVTRVPYEPAMVGYEPDGTPLSVELGADGNAVLVEWSGQNRRVRTPLSGVKAPPIAPVSATSPATYRTSLAVTAGSDLVAVTELRGRHRIALVAADSTTGTTVGELLVPRGELNQITWLDNQTLLVARTPYFVAWRPRTGELLRVTDARSLGDGYWQLSAAPVAGDL